MVLMYPRTIKVRSSSGTVHEYVRVVEAYREAGKVKQRVVADLGRKDLLLELLPKLRRLLTGDIGADTGDPPESQILDASNWGPVLGSSKRKKYRAAARLPAANAPPPSAPSRASTARSCSSQIHAATTCPTASR